MITLGRSFRINLISWLKICLILNNINLCFFIWYTSSIKCHFEIETIKLWNLAILGLNLYNLLLLSLNDLKKSSRYLIIILTNNYFMRIYIASIYCCKIGINNLNNAISRWYHYSLKSVKIRWRHSCTRWLSTNRFDWKGFWIICDSISKVSRCKLNVHILKIK